MDGSGLNRARIMVEFPCPIDHKIPSGMIRAWISQAYFGHESSMDRAWRIQPWFGHGVFNHISGMENLTITLLHGIPILIAIRAQNIQSYFHGRNVPGIIRWQFDTGIPCPKQGRIHARNGHVDSMLISGSEFRHSKIRWRSGPDSTPEWAWVQTCSFRARTILPVYKCITGLV